MTRTWARHVVLHAKARRDGRVGHFHRWLNVTSFTGTAYVCETCGKRISERQLCVAESVAALFSPTKGLLLFVPKGRFFR